MGKPTVLHERFLRNRQVLRLRRRRSIPAAFIKEPRAVFFMPNFSSAFPTSRSSTQGLASLLQASPSCQDLITHKYMGSQQFSRVEYSTQIYRFDARGAKEYSKVLAVELSIQPHVEINYLQQSSLIVLIVVTTAIVTVIVMAVIL